MTRHVGIVGLVLGGIALAAVGGTPPQAKGVTPYEWNHYVVSTPDIPEVPISALAIALNTLANEGWEITYVFQEADPIMGGTVRYSIVARRPRVAIPLPEPTPVPPTMITCPSDPHPACAFLPSGAYPRDWADKVAGVK